MAQRDPLVEYQREGYAMFQQMMGAIREEVSGFMFNLEVQIQDAGDHTEVAAKGLERPASNAAQLTYTAPDEDGHAETTAARNRNAAAQAIQAAPAANKPNNGKGSSFFKN
jgi:preprotein translocase subunit SecA